MRKNVESALQEITKVLASRGDTYDGSGKFPPAHSQIMAALSAGITTAQFYDCMIGLKTGRAQVQAAEGTDTYDSLLDRAGYAILALAELFVPDDNAQM